MAPARSGSRIALTMLLVAILGHGALAPGRVAAVDDPDVATRPNADRPLTSAELLHIRGELFERSFRPVWLVADVALHRDVPLRGPGCTRAGRCPFGVLRSSAGSDVGAVGAEPVVKAHRRVRARFPDDDSPILARLAFQVSRNGLVLLGSVDTIGPRYAVPLEPDAIAAAHALAEGALIVVRGHLSALGDPDACPAPPAVLDPRDPAGRGSPFVRCPAGWLTSEPVGRSDLADPLAPLAPAFPIQHGALERFMRDLPRGEAATFLLERVADPRPAAEGALGWEVIGRLDPVDPGLLAGPGADEPSDGPDGLDWRPVIPRQPPADTARTLTTSWAEGITSVHAGRDRILTAWTMTDGSWRSAPLPVAIRSVGALLPLAGGLALIANARPSYPDPWAFDVWRSNDGLRWRRVSRRRITHDVRFADRRRRGHGIWSLGDRLVVLETYTTARCCGRGPATILLQAGRRQRRSADVTFAWISRDGRSWTRARARGVRANGDHVGGSIFRGDGELLAVWPQPERSIGRSIDGVRWTTVGPSPAELDTDSPLTLARTPGGLIIAGEPVGSGPGPGNFLAIWHRDPSGRWERTYERTNSVASSIATRGDTVIVAGETLDPRTFDEDDPARLPWIIVSTDGGRTWDEALGWTGDEPWCLGDLATSGAIVTVGVRCPPPHAATRHAVPLGNRADARTSEG